MKQLLIILLLLSSVYSRDFKQEILDIEFIETLVKELDTDELIKIGEEYIDSVSLETDKDKASEKAQEIQDKIQEMAEKTFKTMKSKVRHLNVEEARNITYEVKVLTQEDGVLHGTAVALSRDGKLITRYSTIDRYKEIIIIDSRRNAYTPKVGKISRENDLAYLYINVMNIPYVSTAGRVEKGEKLYSLNYEGILLSGVAVNIKENTVNFNTSAKNARVEGGIFNDGNQLISFHNSRPRAFKSIKEEFKYQALKSKPYDIAYCNKENDLRIWEANRNSKDLNVQEFHALFVGLCQKVENKDLTRQEARGIFEKSRSRIFP